MRERKYVLTLEKFKSMKYSKLNENNENETKALKVFSAVQSLLLSDDQKKNFCDVDFYFDEDDTRFAIVNIDGDNDDNDDHGIPEMKVNACVIVIFYKNTIYYIGESDEFIGRDTGASNKSEIIIQREGYNDLYTRLEEFNEQFDNELEQMNLTKDTIRSMANFISDVFENGGYKIDKVEHGKQIPELG